MTQEPEQLIIEFAGFCERPGARECWGWVLKRGGVAIAMGSGTRPSQSTNTLNQAEYFGLGCGLRAAAVAVTELAASELIMRGDSRLVINQVCGLWEAKAPEMIRLRDRCGELLKQIGLIWRTEYIDHAANATAGMLASDEYMKHEKKRPAKKVA